MALPVSAALATWLKRCWTPSGHVSLVPLLLAAGADPSTANVRGVFPLGAAASRGCVETVSALLAASADITACDLNGTRPLALAAFCGNTDVTRELIAATRAAGIDVDHRDGSGATALWLAASAGHDADVELLLGAGAAKDAANGGAVTALRAAENNGHPACVALLQR